MSMTSKELYTLIGSAFAPEFPIGRNGLLSTPPINGCCRVVGVGTRVDRGNGLRYIAPTIHVRSMDIETIYVHLHRGLKPKPRLDESSTLSRQIGYLEPRNSYHEWGIEGDLDAERVILDMKNTILTYGPVLWNRFDTKEAIFSAVERGEYIWPTSKPYKLPIVYGLTDRKEEAIALLIKTAASMKHPIYDEFVRNWFAYFMPGTKSPV